MKCLVFFVAIVALASANVLKQESVTLRCQSGNQMMISQQNGLLGEQLLEIGVVGPQIVPQKIQIDTNNQIVLRTSGTSGNLEILANQMQILGRIVNEYQGIVDEKTCEILVEELQKTIQIGQVSNGLLSILQVLEQGPIVQNLIVGQGNLYPIAPTSSQMMRLSPSGMTLVQNFPMVQRSMGMIPLNQNLGLPSIRNTNTIGMTPNNLRNVLYGQQLPALQRLMA